MKTPDEIKKGLELHRTNLNCDGICPYDGWNAETGSCIQRLMKDTVEYIQQLESRLAQAERERDAAVNDAVQIAIQLDFPACEWCKHKPYNHVHCKECRTKNEGFEWRGVCPENTKDGADA